MISVKKLRPDAKLPTRGSDLAAGYDFFAAIDAPIILKAGGGRAAIPTGLSFSLPEHLYLRVAARSGTAVKNGISELCGVIDADFRGELMIVLVNTDPTNDFVIENGQKIAQGVLERYEVEEWVDVGDDALPDTARGSAGLGSTGQR